MTVTANTTRNDYTAGSAQSVYNYTFQLNEAADVDVYLNGVKQTLNTHYTVQNVDNASGGTITFTLVDASNNPIHPTQGAVINIVMAMDLDRDTNYQPSGAFLAADVNNDFDRLWHASNQQQTAINRSLRLQDTDVTTSTMELPLKDARKGKLLGFNASTGDPEATTNNQTNWDTAYNDRITSASFSGSTLTLGQQDGGTITASHTPYLPIAGGTLTGDLAFGVNKAVFPSLEIYGAIGDHSIIEETGSGNLIIKGTDVRIQSADNEDVIKGVANGAVTIYYDNAPKLATTNTGISITGTLSATGYNSSNWDTAYNDKINAVNYSNNTLTLTQQDGSTLTTTINGGGGGGETLAQTLAIGDTTGGNDISFGDNDKAQFGASNDLQIYHNGSNSIIDNTGTGSLIIQDTDGTGDILIKPKSGQTAIAAYNDNTVEIAHSGNVKLATTSSGIDVTGTVTASEGFAMGSGDQISSTGSMFIDIDSNNNNTTGTLDLTRDGKTKKTARFAENGDISFYEDTGTTPSLLWDSSATALTITGRESSRSSNTYAFEVDNSAQTSNLSASGSFRVKGNTGDSLVVTGQGNVGIGTTSPSAALDVIGEATIGSGTYGVKLSYSNSATAGVIDTADSADKLSIRTGGSEKMRIDSSGNLLVGTTTTEIANATTATGIVLNNGGWYEGSRDGGTVGYFNRLSSNGEVIAIRKDGTTVGSIGVVSGSNFYINNGDTGLGFRPSADDIVPVSSGGSGRDNAIDIGDPLFRFKDLYLSGTAYADEVGIGTTSPNYSLTSYKVGANANYLQVVNGSSGPNAANGILYGLDGAGNGVINKQGAGDLITSVAGAERMRIDSSGNVGIGTTSPSQELHIASSGEADIRLQGSSSANHLDIFHNASDFGLWGTGTQQLKLATNNSEAMRIDSSGNVGIGTASPDRALHVNSGTTNEVARFESTDTACLVEFKDTTGTASIETRNDFRFSAGGSEKMRIDSSGKVGIGTVSPESPLHVAGDIRLDNASYLLSKTSSGGSVRMLGINAGNVAYVGPIDGGPSGTIYNASSSSAFASFYTAGSEKMRIDSSGNVGIGTSSPANDLHISSATGSARLTSTVGGANVYMESADNNNTRIRWSSNANFAIRNDTTATDVVTINQSGNVGIGTTSPANLIDIFNSDSASIRIRATNTAATLKLEAPIPSIELTDTSGSASDAVIAMDGNALTFDIDASERMRLASSGNVGIGTDAPSALLHVDSGNSGVTPTSGTQLFLEGTANATLQLGTLYTGNSRINFGRGSTPGGPADVDVGRILYNAQLNYMGFSTNNQERFRVDSSGRMLIGTTSLGSYGAKLRVEGNAEGYRYIASSYGSTFKDSGNFGVAGITLHSWSSGGTFSQKIMSFKNSGTTEYGSITIAGTATSYNTSSDERLKENIKDAEDAGDKIDAIKIRQFDWKEGGQHQDYGVIAQELNEVAPEAVTKGFTEDDMMSVDYSKLVPTLIKEIQSLRNRVAELEKN